MHRGSKGVVTPPGLQESMGSICALRAPIPHNNAHYTHDFRHYSNESTKKKSINQHHYIVLTPRFFPFPPCIPSIMNQSMILSFKFNIIQYRDLLIFVSICMYLYKYVLYMYSGINRGNKGAVPTLAVPGGKSPAVLGKYLLPSRTTILLYRKP